MHTCDGRESRIASIVLLAVFAAACNSSPKQPARSDAGTDAGSKASGGKGGAGAGGKGGSSGGTSTGVASAETKVACVGDSITEMPGWCTGLSDKLGAGYTVGNFGVSGTNLLKDIAAPYWTSDQFTPSHDFAPNIVIIMLGSNDTIPNTWSGKAHFVADYEDLIDSYTSLASHPRVYSILPPPIGASPFGHSGDILANEVVPMIKQAAMNKRVTTIDVFAAFGGTNFDASLFGSLDQVHPSDKGHQLIADTVYAALMSSGGLGGR